MKKYALFLICFNLTFADSFLFHMGNDVINDTDRDLT